MRIMRILCLQVDATDCHFAYRMIMVLLRRELTLEQVCGVHVND